MKQIACIVFLFALVQKPPQPEPTYLIHNGFLKAQAFFDLDEHSKRAYAMGFMDGMYLAPFFGAPDQGKPIVSLASCVEGMKSSQVAAIIEKYVKEHPENWHHDLKGEAFLAMRKACPVND